MSLQTVLINLIVAAVLIASTAQADEKLTAGWVEQIKLYPGGALLHAKLDTGADSSSLNASDIVEFERDGGTWVRFVIQDSNGKKFTWEREVIGTVRIKRHGRPSQVRDIIKAGVCLGDRYMLTNVTLVDRNNFNYQVLLGRAFLAAHAMIDPSATFKTKPTCKVPAEQ